MSEAQIAKLYKGRKYENIKLGKRYVMRNTVTIAPQFSGVGCSAIMCMEG